LKCESTANDTFNYWLPLLQELLPSSLLEQVKKKASEIVREILTEYELIVDSAEQPRRPGEYKEQKSITQVRRKTILLKPNYCFAFRKDIVDVMRRAWSEKVT